MTDYKELVKELEALSSGVKYEVSLLSNASALLYSHMDRINWCGFYLYRDGKLILGPFQGKPACLEIEMGRGVCGTAAKLDVTMVVPNVHEFPGHIACDCASNSEIVIPLYVQGELYGVLDIDSPELSRFDAADQAGLEDLASALESILNDSCS